MFNNQSIKPLRFNKPHIVFVDGFWRVSKMPRGFYPSEFLKAHTYVHNLNLKLHRINREKQCSKC